jgi:hypothetical protein
MYAAGTDLTKLPFTDTMQPNPLYKPQSNAQKNDQQWGQGNWAYSTAQPQQPAAPQTKQSGSMDFSAYSPGKAQPTQTPSTGTTYDPQGGYYNASGQKFGAIVDYVPGLSSQQAQSSYGQLANSKGYYQQQPNPSLGSAYSPSNQGLVWNQTEQAYLPPAQPKQPAMQQPTTMQAGVYGPGGEYYGANQSQGLADAMRQRDAFVQQSMQAIMPYQVANFTKQDFGAPQIDLQGLRNSASQMVQDGFYNPFTKYFEQQQQQQTMAPEALNPYAPPSLYGNPYGMQQANPYFMPQMNPYFMQAPPSLYGPQNTSMPRGNVDPNLPSDTGWWGMGPQPPVQAGPYSGGGSGPAPQTEYINVRTGERKTADVGAHDAGDNSGWRSVDALGDRLSQPQASGPPIVNRPYNDRSAPGAEAVKTNATEVGRYTTFGAPSPSPEAPPRPGMTYVPAEYRDGKLWSDAHYVNNAPPIPEYAPDGMTRPGGATPLIRSDGWSGYYDPATNQTVTEREARPDPRATAARPGQAQPIQPPTTGMPYGNPFLRSNKPSAEEAQATLERNKAERRRLARERQERDLARKQKQWATNQQLGNSAVIAWNRLQGR